MENEIIADLHIHSRFSRATSKDLTVENLEKWAKVKGINLLGTGDFTHPEWLKELKANLSEEKGIFKTKNNFNFMLTGEISLVFTKNSKGRRVHLVLLAPNFETVDEINKYFDTKGRRDYDGRPIFGISCEQITEDLLKISKDIEIIPAHAWTPWFGIFGSMSGFDNLKDAFGEHEKNIRAIETGMSSTPAMNWKLSYLNDKSIISFSDSHSFWPWRLGREATIFSGNNFSYSDIIKQIHDNTFKATIETSPNYGKYHFDGHRLCDFSCSPQESEKLKNICPVCKKPLTIGVENRVEHLADNPSNFKPKGAKPFYSILPLHELISLEKGSAMASKVCWNIHNKFIDNFENELNILLYVEKEKLARVDEKITELIIKNRAGKIKVKPGYDGEYGKAVLEESQKKLI